jgi:sugar phosphate isomerase/epimerase
MALLLGGPIYARYLSSDEWVERVREAGWKATTCPVDLNSSDSTLEEYERVAKTADVMIAEVGAWSNPISPNAEESAAAIEKCKRALYVADKLDAGCAVTIAGSRGTLWDGPHPDNLTEDTFDLIVQVTREIIDSVQPTRSTFALETMPWVWPNSPQSYLRLVEAIDRKAFSVHLDPVNMTSRPERALNSTAFLQECFEVLGDRIRNIHAKDFKMAQKLTVHISEVQPGKGAMDYRTFLRLANQLPGKVGFLLEHMETWAEYAEARDYVRSVGAEIGVPI